MRRIGMGVVAVAVLMSGAAQAAMFDAIAIDDTLGGKGGNGDYAVGQGPTQAEARRIAMSNCTLGGNKACTIKLVYPHCGAYAASSRRAGTGTGDSLAAATGAAITSCGEAGCKLVVSDCVDVPLRPPEMR